MLPDTLLIDGIHNVKVKTEGRFLNECRTLEDLQNGLFSLYKEVKHLEIQYANSCISEGKTLIGWNPNLKIAGVQQTTIALLPSYFHWFANSLVNYVHLSALVVLRVTGKITDREIRFEGRKVHGMIKDYVNSIKEIEDVLHFRNKVSAHFAITDALKSDTPSLLFQTLFQSPASSIKNINGAIEIRFVTGALVIEIEGQTYDFPQWSLTEGFEKLGPRYWPDGTQFLKERKLGMSIPPNFMQQGSDNHL